MTTEKISIVVPCYNEALCLHELYRRVSLVCCKEKFDHEIILVDDGSTDETLQVMRSLVIDDENVIAVSLSRNHGHQLALTAGLTVSSGDYVLIIDADLQDPPELLPEMVKLMKKGAEVVYGCRKSRSGETWFKRTSAKLFYRILFKFSDVKIPIDTGDFRLISRRALNILLSMRERYRFNRGLVSWIGFDQVPIFYDRDARFSGDTKYPLARMLSFAADAVTGFSVAPLRFASFAGVLSGVAALGMVFFIIIEWYSDRTIPGWTSTLAVILILNTLQFFLLSMLGEYLGRTYMEIKERPLFVIDSVAVKSSKNTDELKERILDDKRTQSAKITIF